LRVRKKNGPNPFCLWGEIPEFSAGSLIAGVEFATHILWQFKRAQCDWAEKKPLVKFQPRARGDEHDRGECRLLAWFLLP